MKSRTKKGVARRTMRVATAFTGAAAGAAAFMPAAMAGTAHQAGVMTFKLRDGGTLYAKRLANSPNSIQMTQDCAAVPRWVHVEISHSMYCFGYHGTMIVWGELGHLSNHPSKECGGTNNGYLSGISGAYWGFGPGHTYTDPKIGQTVAVHISSWPGPNTDTCAATAP
jgi:hypothetical protein